MVLRLFLIGLIALVPDKEKGAVTVVLREMRQAKEIHYPVLIYQCSDDVAMSQCGILEGDELEVNDILNESSVFGGRIILGEQIRIAGGADGALSFAPGRDRGWFGRTINSVRGDLPNDRRDGKGFSWVPEMSNISPRHGRIASRHLANPSAREIAGVLDLRDIKGTVSTFGFVDMGCQIYSFTFKQSAESPSLIDDKQALADITLIEIPLQGDEATLTFTSFGGEPAPPLILRDSDGDSLIDVVLGNLPPYEDLDCSDMHATADMHFALYYPLADLASPGPIQIPFRGSRKVFNAVGEGPPPSRPGVVGFVEAEPCLTSPGVSVCVDPHPASTNRPICTQVVFEQPES